MTFNDILKSSFLEKAIEFSLTDVFIALFMSLALSLFIVAVYKKTYAGVMYSSSFAVTLVAMSMVTTLIILAVTSNVILSLGMVGALSIVRFRTAVKEPLDIAYLFWAISFGIVTGAGLLGMAVVGSLIIGLVLFAFSSRKTNETPYVVVLNLAPGAAENTAMATIKKAASKTLVKAKTASAAGTELTVEVRLPAGNTAFINELAATPGVESALLVTYNGDYMA